MEDIDYECPHCGDTTKGYIARMNSIEEDAMWDDDGINYPATCKACGAESVLFFVLESVEKAEEEE